MKIKVELLGRIRTFDVLGGATFLLALEPPRWQRPSGTNYGSVVTREYTPIHYDPQTDTAICLATAEYWL